MKLSIDGGAVVLSLENKVKAYLSEYGVYFKGFYRGRLKMEFLGAEEFKDKNYVLTTNAYWLEQAVEGAEKHGVAVAEEVRDKLREWQAETDKLRVRVPEQPALTRREEIWKRVSENGCGGCKYKTRQDDDYFCNACGKLLPEKNVPGYVGGVYLLFNYKAFPTDSCPYNINKAKGAI